MADISLHYSSKAPLAGTYTAFNQILADWRRRARERRELASLDSRTIRDLGLSASEVQFEVNKPFWRKLIPCNPERARSLPCAGLTIPPDPGRRSTLSLPVDRRLFLFE